VDLSILCVDGLLCSWLILELNETELPVEPHVKDFAVFREDIFNVLVGRVRREVADEEAGPSQFLATRIIRHSEEKTVQWARKNKARDSKPTD